MRIRNSKYIIDIPSPPLDYNLINLQHLPPLTPQVLGISQSCTKFIPAYWTAKAN
ncbi:MAG: hypothetical protein ACKN9K_15645 [Dolichospermum sp.]